jgi:hypothetical protein
MDQDFPMRETDLNLEPGEASDLCRLEVPELLSERRWDRAFLTVLDDAPAEECLVVLGHDGSADPAEGWEAVKVGCTVEAGEATTHDAEACARRDGFIWMLGSQYGDKEGPLDPARSWAARVREADIAAAILGEGPAPLQLARQGFALHRALNDALRDAALEVIELGAETRGSFIDATVDEGAENVRRGDDPVNVEAAEFRAGGGLLLGLRYPTGAGGQPLMVEIADPASLFDEPGTPPATTGVWWLSGAGGATGPAGVRGLHSDDGQRFDAVVGDVDVAEHPEGEGPGSTHVRFTLPVGASGGGPLTLEASYDLAGERHVEGVASEGDGHAHYVIDRDGQVSLGTLMLGA